MAKAGPKGPRAKVKRVLLISGHPDCLYNKVPREFYALIWKDKTYQLGKCGDGLPRALKEMNTYAQVISTKRTSTHTVPLPDCLRASIKKVGDNTHITVSAVDDEELAEEISKVIDYLEELGLSVKERCHWTCDYDPGSKSLHAPAPTPIPTPMPVKLPDTPGKYWCKVHEKNIMMPRDCDYCIVKKQCGEFEEFKKKVVKGG